jgi:PAS domain S-box-containing protein
MIARSLVFLWIIGSLSAAAAQESLPRLTSIAAIKRLSEAESRKGYPVQLRGVISYYDSDLHGFYLQDDLGGIFVELQKHDPSIKAGKFIEVEGTSASGSYLPIVAKTRYKFLGIENPLPAIKISLSKLNPFRDDGRWMQLEGIVHNTYQEGVFTVLEVYEGKHKVQIRIRDYSHSAAGNLIDSTIQTQGVLAVIADSARQPLRLELRIPNGNQIKILAPPPLLLNKIPITSIASLEKQWASGPPQHRIRVHGTVMPAKKENSLLVKDKTGIISAQTLFTRPIDSGDEVELIGFADLGSPYPRLINAFFLRIKATAIESNEEAGLPLLTKIQQVRSLSAKEAKRGYPVRIKGVITFHNPQLSMTFIQDDSDAIYLQSLDPTLYLEKNAEYEVTGFSAPGDFAPIITKPKFRLLGKASLPVAKVLSLNQLSTGKYDCRRVQVSGIVRYFQQVGNRWRLELFDGDKFIQVWLPSLANSSYLQSLQDSKIRVQGICSIQISEWGNINGFRLNVADLNEVTVEEPAKFDPSAAPLYPIRDIFRYSGQKASEHRIRIQGVLLHQQPGKALFLRDDSGTITVPISSIVPANPSDILVISGYPTPGEFSPTLEYALIKRLSSGPPPAPKILDDARALNGSIHGNLVRIRARLVDQWRGPEGLSFFMQDLAKNTTAFEAYLEKSAYRTADPVLRNNSELELTGICLLHPNGTQKSGLFFLLRTPADIRVIKNAPWWTTKHTIWAIGTLLSLILVAFVLVAMLKLRVNRQTKIIKQSLEIEAALERKYRELFEESQDIVFTCDQRGKLQSINPAGTRTFGYTWAEFLDMDPLKLVAPNSLPKIQEWIEKRQQGIECPVLECELLAKDNRCVTVEINGEILYANGEFSGARGIARDITERKISEEALHRSEEKLRHAQKLEAIGNLAGGIAHDFNNILVAILGYAELSTSEVPSDHPIASNLEQITKAAKRARNVVRQILAFSRKFENARSPILLQGIMEEVLHLLKASVPATIEIQTQIDPHCRPVMADSTQMHQIILNLVTNAAHAMKESGGCLSIELDNVNPMEGDAVAWQELPPGKYVRLTVRDTGPGIDPQIQKQIFEPYFTTKPVGEGSGLGLAVVQGIVESHGGAIQLISDIGKGACFYIYLPTCKEEISTPSKIQPATNGGKGRILIVDDEEAIVILGIRNLGKLGYHVTGETNSIHALELFLKDPQQFDLIITDQTMPQLTGLSLAQEMWKVRPNIPIIISTGYSDSITPENSDHLGFHTILHKPYTAAELSLAIQRCLSGNREVRG